MKDDREFDFTYSHGVQKHWEDESLYEPSTPSPAGYAAPSVPFSGVAAPRGSSFDPATQADPSMPDPSRMPPFDVNANVAPIPDLPPPGRHYAFPRKVPTWQHASIGAPGESVFAVPPSGTIGSFLNLAVSATLGYLLFSSWKGAAAGGLLWLGASNLGWLVTDKENKLTHALVGVGASGAGGYMVYRFVRPKGALANIPPWLKPKSD